MQRNVVSLSPKHDPYMLPTRESSEIDRGARFYPDDNPIMKVIIYSETSVGKTDNTCTRNLVGFEWCYWLL